MQVDWIWRKGNPRLAVIVMGWASDGRLVRDIIPEGFDALCLYDYRDIGEVLAGKWAPGAIFDPSQYSRVSLIAWSFGVWAAERLFGPEGPFSTDFDKAVALNGTPLPADELCGIGSRRLAVTIRGLAKGGKELFDRKAYGPDYRRLSDFLSPRSLDDNIRELEELSRASAVAYMPSIEWNYALMGTLDEIFPPDNMARYWGSRGEKVPLYHYPFGDESINKEIF
ncbi:MAG: DUF452 family protein [Rikenellaceae bacterium]|nr:DUF452 family protein [Rikenellaceae bacterium]